MKLTLKQKELLNSIENKNIRREIKKEFKKIQPTMYVSKWKFLEKPLEYALSPEKLNDITNPQKAEKPPLGLKPKWCHDEQRFNDVHDAIIRYEQSDKAIPIEWAVEHSNLKTEIELRNSKKLSDSKKEFCVEITEENKEILENIWHNFHINYSMALFNGHYLCSNSKFSFCQHSNANCTNESKSVLEIVSTEEFLRLIEREDLSETPEPKENDKLEFDLPKKEAKLNINSEEYIEEKNHLCWIYNRLMYHGENTNFYMHKLKEIALNFSENKQFTVEDMRKCFCQGTTVFDKNPPSLIVLNDAFENFMNL